MANRPRVLVVLPQSDSAPVADWLLAAGFEPIRRSTLQTAADELQARPCALVVADTVFPVQQLYAHGRLRTSPTPTILIGERPSATADPHGSAYIMHLERPLDRGVFICYVSMAILDNRPVRRSVRKPVQGFDAVVNGMPSRIIDVSAEGLRLELTRDKRSVLPPYFTVRVPLVGVAVTVQRMWTQSSSSETTKLWYGGALLSQNRVSIQQAWRSFVDTVPALRESSLVQP